MCYKLIHNSNFHITKIQCTKFDFNLNITNIKILLLHPYVRIRQLISYLIVKSHLFELEYHNTVLEIQLRFYGINYLHWSFSWLVRQLSEGQLNLGTGSTTLEHCLLHAGILQRPHIIVCILHRSSRLILASASTFDATTALHLRFLYCRL